LGLRNCNHDCLAYREYIEQGGMLSSFRGESLPELESDACSRIASSRASLAPCFIRLPWARFTLIRRSALVAGSAAPAARQTRLVRRGVPVIRKLRTLG